MSQRYSLRLTLRAGKSCFLVQSRLVLSDGHWRSVRRDLSHAVSGLDPDINWLYNLSSLGHVQVSLALEVRPIAQRSIARADGCQRNLADLQKCQCTDDNERRPFHSLMSPVTTALTSVAKPILNVSGLASDVCTARRLLTARFALASTPTGSSSLSAGAVSHLQEMRTEGNAALCIAARYRGQHLRQCVLRRSWAKSSRHMQTWQLTYPVSRGHPRCFAYPQRRTA